ncbi:MAG: chemotaxis protein CheA, partial [Campylobacterales bacterium]|nr:chemotaxis protein CheA [Campylobacterales bacterium]
EESKSIKSSVVSKNFLKIDAQKLDELFDSIGELVIAQNCLGENAKIKAVQDAEVSKTIENLSKITRLIQNRVMGLRMVPIRDTFEKMKRVVRDSSKKVNKPIHLSLEGEETEIDKTMVEALSDPLVHIIRNAIDHGIESSPEERKKAGKSEEGNVSLRAYHRGGSIIIEVRDDGRGINKAKVYQKALERGIIEKDELLSDAQIYGLIMQPGFSTADTISDISGRGVGLDVVRTAIEGVRGKVDISSQEGIGTTFSIVLPLTLAIIDGMLVRSNEKIFIIPTLSITESFRPLEQNVHIAGGKEEFVQLRSELLPIVRLSRVLELDESSPAPWECTLVCIENGKGKFALLVDELVGRQQVVIKTLGSFLSKTEGVSGGAVMGNGEIALILNVEELY